MKIFENKELKIENFISGTLNNNSYLISSKLTEDSFIVDVPDNPRELINKIPRNRLNKSQNLEKIKLELIMPSPESIDLLNYFAFVSASVITIKIL